MPTSCLKLEKLFSLEDRGQTDRVTTTTRAGLRRYTAGLGQATLQASPR